MATALQSIQDTRWSYPNAEMLLYNISNHLNSVWEHESKVSEDTSPIVRNLTGTDKTKNVILRPLWDWIQQSCSSLHARPSLSVCDTSIDPLDWSPSCITPAFVSRILSTIRGCPVEDGFEHPAEDIIREALFRQQSEVIKWLRSLISMEKDSCVLASVIKCVARLNESECPDWVYKLAAQALEHRDVEVRDAAAQALELCGTLTAVELLKDHSEPIYWLREYIDRVTLQLEGQ
jgi:hypothetical protein